MEEQRETAASPATTGGNTTSLRDRALALILKARGGDTAEPLLACLDDERRARIAALLAEAPGDAEAELRRLRAEELETLERECERRFGAAWGEFSPAIRFWAWSKT